MPTNRPDRIPDDSAVTVRFNRLLERFSDDDIRARAQAQKDILILGSAAAPLLFDASGHRDPEIAARCRDTLERLWLQDAATRALWLGDHPAWERDVEVQATGLAVLCFLGAGYSQLSTHQLLDTAETYRTHHYGKIVKKGLQWLLAQQNEEGSFAPGNPTAHAVATLAISEAYGMTAVQVLQGPADRAIQFLSSARSKDSAFNVWKMMALISAVLSELPIHREVYEEQRRLLAEDPAPLARAGLLLRPRADGKPGDALLEWFSKLDPDTLDPEELSVATYAAGQVWGRGRSEWARWTQQVKARLEPAQLVDRDCGYGSWVGPSGGYGTRLLSTMCTIITVERTQLYPNVFGPPNER